MTRCQHVGAGGFIRSIGVCLMMTLSFFIVVAGAQASYLRNYPITYTQPTGEKLTIYLTGDEYFRYAHTANGTIVDADSSGMLRYAKLSASGKIEANTIKVTKSNKKTYRGLKASAVNPRKNLVSSDLLEQNEKMYGEQPASQSTGAERSKLSANLSLTKSSLSDIVIYVRFEGESEFLNSSLLSNDESMLNGTEKSLKTFIAAQSEGACTLTSVFPQKNGSSVTSYEDVHSRGYYQHYSLANPEGYRTDDEMIARENELIARAAMSVAQDPDVPAASALDKNSDGEIDTMSFVISGDADSWEDLIWPHTTTFSSDTLSPSINGKKVGNYTFQLSAMYSDRSELLSVFAHETMHMLGFPDLYRYTYAGTPIGSWDIMATNQTTPQYANSYMRYNVAGWGEAPQTISGSGAYTLKAPTASGTAAESFYYNAGNGDYLVFEYRKNTPNSWDEDLPNSGLLVYRVRPLSAMSQYGNAYSGGTLPDTYYIYRPGEAATSNLPWYRAAQGSLNSATLSSSNARSTYGAPYDSVTSLFGSNGSRGSLVVYNVGSTQGDTITFSVKFQYCVTFDAQNGTNSVSSVLEKGSTIARPANPTKSGYKFLGWYSSPTGGTLYGFDTPLNSHVTLYAHWGSPAAYVTQVTKSTGTWNHAWSKTLYYPQYRTLTIARSRSSVKIRPYCSSGSKLYVRYSGGTWSLITGSKTVYVSRGASKTLYFKCVAEAGNKHTYKLVVKRKQ